MSYSVLQNQPMLAFLRLTVSETVGLKEKGSVSVLEKHLSHLYRTKSAEIRITSLYKRGAKLDAKLNILTGYLF